MQDNRDMVKALLQRQGAQVRDADNAEDGFTLLQEWRPDIVLCDIGMPLEDGYSFIERVRTLPAERGGAIPAIAVTAYGRSEDRLLALSCGFQQHLAKPVDPAELTAAIANVIRRSTF
jgi:CheY-like chemotaxis protein